MISALSGDGVRDLKRWLAAHVPAGPWLYPRDQISDAPLRQFAAEITREKLYLRLHQELPYQSTVETEVWKELKDGAVRIEQTIYVERESQRKIVLGKGGQTIKAIGTAARADIAVAIEQPVHLFLSSRCAKVGRRSRALPRDGATQAQHTGGVLAFQFDQVLGTQAMVASSRGMPLVSSTLSTFSWLAGSERISHWSPSIAQVVGAGIQNDVHQLIFGGLIARNEDLAAAFEHPRDAALLAHIAAVLGERVADVADGSVAVVGGHIHQNGRAARTVALEHDFLDHAAFQFARATHDGFLDVVGGHGDRFGGKDGGTQTRVAIRIAAITRGDGDFFDNARETLAALGVRGRLFMLNGCPFGMA